MVGPRTIRFKRFTGCLASPRLSLVSTLLRTFTAALTRYAFTDDMTGNERGHLTLLRASKSKDGV